MRKTIMVCLSLALTALALMTGASPASADSTFQPSFWNGRSVYLSVACHDGNDGVPGGPCIANIGCSSYNENTGSYNLASRAAIGTGTGMNLVERGYKARIGDGTLSANLGNSNAWGADLHMPLHSNAAGSGPCSGGTASVRGTWGLYEDAGDANCANHIVQKVGGLSPGYNDKPVASGGLGELRANAPSCYFESEFHTWASGRNFLVDHLSWSYKVGATADAYFGR
ncbi:hypothetical protein [Nocardioides sp. InS609-2]|uniref:hypothetical protein n=1 Tax=Nocardioides sp. InS609-2 TaxID=2760705 RepID=UPI0020BFE6E9|nr:hypothetical protein [Nocardioides sp. InS609-2]